MILLINLQLLHDTLMHQFISENSDYKLLNLIPFVYKDSH